MEVHEHLLPIQGELLTQGKDGRQEWGKGGEERPRAEREDWVQGLGLDLGRMGHSRVGSVVPLVSRLGPRVQSCPAGNTHRRAELRLALALAAFLGFQV